MLQHYGWRDYLTFHPPQPSVTSIRRDVYQRIGGFDPRLRNNNAENMEFELRALRSSRIGIIWQPLVSITDHTASAGADTNKTIVDVVALLEFVLQHHHLTTDETDAITEAIQQRLPRAISGAFALRDFHALAVTPPLQTRPRLEIPHQARHRATTTPRSRPSRRYPGKIAPSDLPLSKSAVLERHWGSRA